MLRDVRRLRIRQSFVQTKQIAGVISYKQTIAFEKARICYPRPPSNTLWPPHPVCKETFIKSEKSPSKPSAPSHFSSLKPNFHQIPVISQNSTMLFSTRKPSFSINLLAITIFIFSQVPPTTAFGVCSRQIFGTPQQSSCEAALVGLPRNTMLQYFVEQQLRRQPGTNWVAFADPRPPSQKQKVVEVPKWWSICPCPILSGYSSPRASRDATRKSNKTTY